MSSDTPIVTLLKRFQIPVTIASFAFSTLAIMFVLSNMATPCNIAHGQTTCNVGDTESFDDVVTFADQIELGPTPYAGDFGYSIYSDDDTDTSPEWWLDVTHVKIADETVSSSVVLQDDDVLTHTFTATPSLLSDPSNEIRRYVVESLLLINSTTTGDFDFQFSMPTNWNITGVVVTDLGASTDISVFDESAETTLQTSSSTQAYLIKGVIHPETLTGTGTVTLQWAQNSAAGDTTVEEGSYIWFKEMRPDPS